uniref:Uncharacterized protein n=1 Tax=Opuntia streptacantha TaxID=393608 RepID=A0A7C9DU59_OPUST
MVCLIVKSPLADDQCCTNILALLYHLIKVLLLLFTQCLKLFHSINLNLMLSLWLRRLKGASQNCYLCIFNFLWHLRMAHVFVNNDSIDKLSIFQFTSNFSLHFN